MSGRADSERILTAMIYDYAELFDTGQFETFASLFEHGVWHTAEPGAEGVRRYIEERVVTYDGSPRTKHVTTNLVLDVDEDAGTAAARSYVTVFQSLEPGDLRAVFSGRYRDRFERVDGEWRWRERTIIHDLTGDVSGHVRRPPDPDQQALV